MQQKKFLFEIDEEGVIKAEVMGVPGQACLQELEKLQVSLNGQKLSEGNTDDFYKPPMSEPVFEFGRGN